MMKQISCFALTVLLTSALLTSAFASEEMPAAIESPPAEVSEIEAAAPAIDGNAAGTCGMFAEWSYSDGKLYISGFGDMYNYTEANHAPWYEYGPVITSVEFEPGITSVGDYAFFGCSALSKVSLSTTVNSIGEHSFAALINLSSIVIPSSVVSIGDYAFALSGLRVIYIPESVTSIGSGAFSGCLALSHIALPRELETISPYCFLNCTSLISVHLPTPVAEIGYGAFNGCSSLEEIHISPNVLRIEACAFLGCESLTTCHFGGSPIMFRRIQIGAYNDCLLDAEIVFPDGEDDYQTLVYIASGILTYGSALPSTFDFSGNGYVSNADAVVLLQYSVGLLD